MSLLGRLMGTARSASRGTTRRGATTRGSARGPAGGMGSSGGIGRLLGSFLRRR